jgi:predicted nuclease of predicted toxin-antitoxin system
VRLLANENIPYAAIRYLREQGHEVAAVVDDMAGAPDELVLSRANEEGRILITFDRDYGELIYLRGLPCPAGLIYIRFAPATPLDAAERVSELIASAAEMLRGSFVVLDREGYRRRSLPHS